MRASPTLLVATWRGGLFAVRSGAVEREIPEGLVAGLAGDGAGGAYAIVGGAALWRRSAHGKWATVGMSRFDLACCAALRDTVFVGTNDARVLRIEADGSFTPLSGFDGVAGRESWYSGAALIDGRMVGPPLGIRSMSATSDHAALLANVHVGGIPRSTDAGATWKPTIDIECDVHQVCAHPTRPEVVAAATGVGLGISRDGGATWSTEQEGLHAPYCSAVAFAGDGIFVAASTDHFAKQGAIYHRPIDGNGPLRPVSGGLPRWLDGISDTGNITASGSSVAVADGGGNLYLSQDGGASWARAAQGLPRPSGVLVC